MKKLLALVLALVMTLGLATIGANAAVNKTTFTDDSEIEHATAATVLNAIGVLQGDAGKFNPKQSLTREQGIKIIIYMLEGQKQADNLKAVSAPFTDVAADRWSAGVIAEAKALKLVDGRGDGSFDPTGELTGSAFGKMLLVALGYEDKYEGFTGADWSLNVARLVNRLGLADKIGSMPYNTAISRDDAAQMAYNTLQTTMVEYTGNLTVDKDGNFGNQRGNQGNTTYEYRTSNPAATNTTMQFCEQYFPNLKLDDTAANARDKFGNPLAHWYIGNTRLDNDRTDAKTITAVTTADKVLTYTDEVKVKTIYADLGLGSDTTIGQAGNNANGRVWIDGNAVATNAVQTVGATTYVSKALAVAGNLSSGDDAKLGGKGILTTVSYTQNDAAEVVITMQTTYLAQAQADYNAKDKELKLVIWDDTANMPTTVSGDPVDSDYFEEAVNAKEDDYFWVTATFDGTAYTVRSLTPVTGMVSGAAVTAYKNTDNVTAAGTKYDYAASAARNSADDPTDFAPLYTAGYDMGNGATYDVILDPYGYVLRTVEHDTASQMSDFVVLKGANVVANMKAEAKLLFSDGSTKTVTIAKVIDRVNNEDIKVGGTGTKNLTTFNPAYVATNNGGAGSIDGTSAAANAALQVGRFYKYHENKNGEYELTFIFDGGVPANTYEVQTQIPAQTVTKDTTNPVGAGLLANAKSTLLSDDKAYVGVKNWVNVAASNVTVLSTKADNSVILGAYTATKGTSTANADEYYLLFNDVTSKVDADGDTYYSYEAIKGGELVTLDVTDGLGANLVTVSPTDPTAMYKVNSWDSGKADTVAAITANEGAGVGYLKLYEQEPTANGKVTIKDSTITFNSTGNSYLLASNVKFYDIDGRVDKDHAPDSVSAGVVKNLDYTGGKAYAFFGMSTDDNNSTIDVLYVVRVA